MTLEPVYDALREAQYANSDSAAVARLCVAVEALTNYVAKLEGPQRPELQLRTYSLTEASKLLGVSLATVNRMTADGALPVIRLTGDEGRPRVRHVDLVRLLEAS